MFMIHPGYAITRESRTTVICASSAVQNQTWVVGRHGLSCLVAGTEAHTEKIWFSRTSKVITQHTKSNQTRFKTERLGLRHALSG
jgi:hypothetical protein